MNMYIPATAAVTMNIRIVSPRSLPTFLVFAILEIELEIEKKMSGTSRTNSRFNHICPIGNRNDALSPQNYSQHCTDKHKNYQYDRIPVCSKCTLLILSHMYLLT